MSNILDDRRINRVVRNFQQDLELQKPLTFLNRVPIGDVYSNDEILAEYSATNYMADIIMNDSKARVVNTGDLSYGSQKNVVPNIKLGETVGQDKMEKWSELARNMADAKGEDAVIEAVTRHEMAMARRMVQGCRNTMNLLCAAAYLDGATYDRFGVKVAAGFNTPANLKLAIIGGAQWKDANSATMDAITDLQALSIVGSTEYGKTYNRVDMSTLKFQSIILSDAFEDQIRVLKGLSATDPVGISKYNLKLAKDLFELISGFTLNLEDANVTFQNAAGADVSEKVLPEAKVILSSSQDDGDDFKIDFAVGIPQEVTAAAFSKNGPDIEQGQQGIVAYYAVNPTLNSPDVTAWAVIKGFPRKKDKYMSAIITAE